MSLVLGVLVLQLGFILSYVGAFHQPTPTGMKVAVVAPEQVAAQTVQGLNGLPDGPVEASLADDEQTARDLVTSGKADAAFVVDPGSTTDTVLVASGAGPALATAAEVVLTKVDATQQRTVRVVDVVPLEPGDGRGLTAFYVVVGWVLGGYLIAAILGVVRGPRPANRRRAVIRLAAMVPYALLSGLGGALIVGPWLDALGGHLILLTIVGSLLVLAAATVTMALEALMGVVGIGVSVLLFVVLGNPSAGGPFPYPLLPTFWRTIGPALPNGAGTTAVRNIVYFDAASIVGPLLVITAYAVIGALVTLALSGRRGTHEEVAGEDRPTPARPDADADAGPRSRERDGVVGS